MPTDPNALFGEEEEEVLQPTVFDPNVLFGAEGAAPTQSWAEFLRGIQQQTAAHYPWIKTYIQPDPNLALSPEAQRAHWYLMNQGIIPEGPLDRQKFEEWAATDLPSYWQSGIEESVTGAAVPTVGDPDFEPLHGIDALMRQTAVRDALGAAIPESDVGQEFMREVERLPTTTTGHVLREFMVPIYHLPAAIVNTIYREAAPERFPGVGGSAGVEGYLPEEGTPLWERISPEYRGGAGERPHPDVQSAIYRHVVNTFGKMVFNQPQTDQLGVFDLFSGIAIASGHPENAVSAMQLMEAAANQPWTGEWEEQIGPQEVFLREVTAGLVLDPFTWMPGFGIMPAMNRNPQALAALVQNLDPGIAARAIDSVTEAERVVNLMSVSRINPNTGGILGVESLSMLEGGIRPPSYLERVKWSFNTQYERLRHLLDPDAGMRRLGLSIARGLEDDEIAELLVRDEYIQMIDAFAAQTGIPAEEVSRRVTSYVEEVMAANRVGVRPRSPNPVVRSQSDIQFQQAEAGVGAGRYVSRPIETAAPQPRPGQVEMFTGEFAPPPVTEPLRTEYGIPRGAPRDYVPGEAPPVQQLDPYQVNMFPTSEEERVRMIDSLVALNTERARRGHIPEETFTPDLYTNLTQGNLERELIMAEQAFINDRASSMIGQAREFWPALRDVTDEQASDFVRVAYQGAYDALNLGPNAPAARERAAGLLTQDLRGNLGYVLHMQDTAVDDAFRVAAGRTRRDFQNLAFEGAQITSREYIADQLGGYIGHGSTEQRRIRMTIEEGNRTSAEGRWWWDKPKAGELPKMRYLNQKPEQLAHAIGQAENRGWTRINRLFEDDLPALLMERRLRANNAIGGLDYMNRAMDLFGTHVPTGVRPTGTATSLSDLVPVDSWRWKRAFGKLDEATQSRIQNTFFDDAQTAKSVLRYHGMASGGSAPIEDMNILDRIFFQMTRPFTRYFKSKVLNPFTAYWFRNAYDDGVRVLTFFDADPSDFVDGFNAVYRGRVPRNIREWMARQINEMGEGAVSYRAQPVGEITADDVTIEMFLSALRRRGVFDSGQMFDEVERSVVYGLGESPVGGRNAFERFRAQSVGAGGQDRGMLTPFTRQAWRGADENILHQPWNPLSTNFYVDELGRQFGMDANNTMRISAFMAAAREEGATLDSAALAVRKVMIDYLDVDPITSRLKQWPIPFITFTRFSIPLNIEAMLTKTARVAARLHTYRAAEEAAISEYGEQIAPGWMNGTVYQWGDGLWFRPENFDALFDVGELISNPADFFERQLSPLMKEPAAQLTNWDRFRDRAVVTRRSLEEVPQMFRDHGMSEETMVRAWHAISNTWRAVSYARHVGRVITGEEGVGEFVSRQIFGFPLFEVEEETSEYFMMRENREQLEDYGAIYQHGNWSFWNFEPTRYEDAAEAMWTRFALQSPDEGFGTDPWTGTERAMTEQLLGPEGYDIDSQYQMTNNLLGTLRGMIRLQAQWELDSERGWGTAPFDQNELEFIRNIMQTVYVTQMGIVALAAEDGELTPQEAMTRIRELLGAVTEPYFAPETGIDLRTPVEVE